MVHLLSKLQDSVEDPNCQLSTVHRTSLHAIVAGILYLLGKISSVETLKDHVLEVVERRREMAPVLLPDSLFQRREGEEEEEEEGMDGAVGRGEYPSHVSEELLFQLRERGLDRQSPDPATEFRRGIEKGRERESEGERGREGERERESM